MAELLCLPVRRAQGVKQARRQTIGLSKALFHPGDRLRSVKLKAHSNEWALWLYWEPSYPSQSSGLFRPDNTKLLAALSLEALTGL
jgi:hypothetical protein